jgi:HEAT repeat protein
MINKQFKKLLNDWEVWSKKGETQLLKEQIGTGWESSYDKWADLIETAKDAMIQKELLDEELIAALEKIWEISEETEDLVDFTNKNIEKCWNNIQKLILSNNPSVRWQIYSALAYSDEKCEQLLRKGLEDSDLYCKRRAYLALATMSPPDAEELTRLYLHDHDPYMRQASIEMSLASKNPNLIKEVKKALEFDKVAYVREALKKITLPDKVQP